MKTELEFLTELYEFMNTNVASISDVKKQVIDRIEDLDFGYTKDEAKEIQRIEAVQKRMDTIDDSRMIKQLIS